MPQNLGSITNFFPTAYENTIPMTLTDSVLAGGTTVFVTGATNYSDGEVVTWVIDPATPALKQVFTGTWNAGDEAVVGVIWTEMPTGGVNVGHSAGATIIDYVTATHWDMAMEGIGKFATQTGTLQTAAVEAALNISNLAANGWNNLGFTETYGANNGNKEFTTTVTGNLTNLLSPGMKRSVTRNTVPPTQCMSFTAASSQYASKSSPSGITFTSAFTCEAWVYLNSYTGSQEFVIGRTDNSTGGFALTLSTTGQIEAFYGGSSNFTVQSSYQSIPLQQWTHIVAVCTSVSSKTWALYVNGTLVPSLALTAAATSLTQQNNLAIGASSGGGNYFDGYIAEARIWSAAQTQATIRANMGINLTTATNLVACYQGNAAWTDSSGNSNTLTANGGASNTQVANPYNPIEYGLITKISYSNPTTTITMKAVGGTIPNETLTNPQYSGVDLPYGWPSTVTSLNGMRLLDLPFLTQQSTTGNTQSFGGSSSTTFWPITVPSTSSKIKIKMYSTTIDNSTATCTFYTYSGTTLLTQTNLTTANNYLSTEILVPVTPGSTINFNIAFGAASGTTIWGSGSGSQQQGVVVEAA